MKLYYYDGSKRQGLSSAKRLRELANEGIIRPETILETEYGDKIAAKDVGARFPDFSLNEALKGTKETKQTRDEHDSPIVRYGFLFMRVLALFPLTVVGAWLLKCDDLSLKERLFVGFFVVVMLYKIIFFKPSGKKKNKESLKEVESVPEIDEQVAPSENEIVGVQSEAVASNDASAEPATWLDKKLSEFFEGPYPFASLLDALVVLFAAAFATYYFQEAKNVVLGTLSAIAGAIGLWQLIVLRVLSHKETKRRRDAENDPNAAPARVSSQFPCDGNLIDVSVPVFVGALVGATIMAIVGANVGEPEDGFYCGSFALFAILVVGNIWRNVKKDSKKS